MKPLKLVGILMALFSALVLFSMIRYGWFHKVVVVEETIPAMTILAISHTGPYQNVGPVMGKLYDDVKGAGVTGSRGVGIYFDSPETVAPEKLRALVGQEISKKDLMKVAKFKAYRSIELPALKAKVVHFPYRGQLSIIFAVFKAYPALKAANGNAISSAAIEIYDIPNKEILFVIPQNVTREQQESWVTGKPMAVVSQKLQTVAESVGSPQDSAVDATSSASAKNYN